MTPAEIDALIARLRDSTDGALWGLRSDAADALAALARENARLDDVEGLAVALVARAERAEEQAAALRECVRAADAWSYGSTDVDDSTLEGRYDAVRAKHRAVIDAALAGKEKE
jgi:hypothetical protein